ncbi:MAG: hypothetical protein AAFP09_05045 [Cyanobacteria bacterium J06607_10]
MCFSRLLSQPVYKLPIACLLLAGLAACNSVQPSQTTSNGGNTADVDIGQTDKKADSDSEDSLETESKAPTSNEAEVDDRSPSSPEPIYPVLAPGDYCYQKATDVETVNVRLAIDSADRVTGNVQGSVHNEANAYYTSYYQSIDGTIDGSNLNLDVATWIEYDYQNEQQTWKVSDRELTFGASVTPSDSLSKESCEVVNKAFQNEEGLEGRDLIDGGTTVHTKEVFFEPGKTSTVVSNAVIRGERDLYRVTAQGGQQMTLLISSLENNARFDVVGPTGRILARETGEDNILLPHTGEYQIVVGGTRGNATYDLEIEIR